MLILMAVCLISSPSTCRQEQVVWSTEATNELQCMASGTFAIVQWQTQHPSWRVARWRCIRPSAKKIAI